MNRIVIGTDGSPGARAAIVKGVALAARVGAQVTFVSVRDVISALRGGHDEQTGASIVSLAALDDALTEAERCGVDADVESSDGDPVAEILRVAQGRDAVLIVVGSKGSGQAAHSSVSDALPRHSRIPVLVVDGAAPYFPARL